MQRGWAGNSLRLLVRIHIRVLDARITAAWCANAAGGTRAFPSALPLRIFGPYANLIPRYLEHLAVRNYSPQTILSQTKQLRHFRETCEQAGVCQVTTITRQVILDYQTHLYHYRKKGGGALANGTQRQWLTAVGSFMAWLTRQGIIPFNPAAELEMPRTEHRLPKAVLTHSEVERVLRSQFPPSGFQLSNFNSSSFVPLEPV